MYFSGIISYHSCEHVKSVIVNLKSHPSSPIVQKFSVPVPTLNEWYLNDNGPA